MMDSNSNPFEGVHFYSVKELGEVLAIHAIQWSKATRQFHFAPGKKDEFAKKLSIISAINAAAYEKATGVRKDPFSAEMIVSALPMSPVPSPQGHLREFLRGLPFNLLGFEPRTEQDYDEADPNARAASSYFWEGDFYSPITGPDEIP